MNHQLRVIIIGGGPAGVEAALTAARAGVKTTLVSDGPVGGRAGWDSLLPSKAWLTAADMAGEIAAGHVVGLSPQRSETGFDPAALLDRLAVIKPAWSAYQDQELVSRGVEIIQGRAAFTDERTVDITIGEAVLRRDADIFILATGSVPRFPDDLKPDGKRVLAPRFASHLNALPASIVVIGAGPTGCEFAYLFDRLSVAVTWIVDPFGVLPQFHPDAGQFLAETYRKRGVNVVRDASATKIDRFDDHIRVQFDRLPAVEADMAFLAIGRRPDLDGLRLEAAGLALHMGWGPSPRTRMVEPRTRLFI